eukprot:PhF_6_TR18825/c0_g1_i1/m.27403
MTDVPVEPYTPADVITEVWYNITVYSVGVCSAIYCIFGFVSIRRRFTEDIRWLFVPVLYAIWGAVFSFLSIAIIAGAIGTAYIALQERMSTVELAVYVTSYVLTFLYFSSGMVS